MQSNRDHGNDWLLVKLSGADKKQAELSMLLKSRADPNVVVNCEWREFATTPLFEAAVNGHTRIARMLLGAGAKVNTKVGPGYSAVYNAAFNGHVDTLRLLVESGADVNAMTEDEFSPLYIACQQGNTACVHALLESNASPDLARAKEGAPALYIASQNGQTTCVEALLSAGSSSATVDLPMSDGSTPLMIACYFQHARVVELLLRAGASLALRDKRGRDALEWAKQRNDALVVALVQEELAARAAARFANGDFGHGGWFGFGAGGDAAGGKGGGDGGDGSGGGGFFCALTRSLMCCLSPSSGRCCSCGCLAPHAKGA